MKKGRLSPKAILASVAICLMAAVIWVITLLVGPTEYTIPSPLSTPSQGISIHLPKVQPRVVESPTSEPRETKIYVEYRTVPSYWGIGRVITGWNLAVNTDFVPVTKCPNSKPCVKIRINPKLDHYTAAETSFGYRNDIYIDLNPEVTNPREAQSTACHEMGHVLGLPHINGTVNTCMTAKDKFYRTLPSSLDLKLANSYGKWDGNKMYSLSEKTVDVRSLPK
jgi:hypothetical protein